MSGARAPLPGLGPLVSPLLLAIALLLGGIGCAGAAPWTETGDLRVRHDLQLLADAGLVTTPVTSWPVSWPDVAADVRGVYADDIRSAPVRHALRRIQRRAREEARTGEIRPHLRSALASNPVAIRAFKAVPRESAEAEVGFEWMGERFAANLQGQAVSDPADDDTYRYDGSYIAGVLGNWMVSVDTLNRWWGPGWDGSLVLSHNARPAPKVAIQRNYADAWDLPVLSWLGPWRFAAFVGRLEEERPVETPKQFGARFTFKPATALEIGLATTALYGGRGRPGGAQALFDTYSGTEADTGAKSGYLIKVVDARWRLPLVPVAVYGQYADESGEDGGYGLAGVEAWVTPRRGWQSFRLSLEYADTAPAFDAGEGAAYASDLYPAGYTFKGRPMGHGMGGQGELLTFTGLWLGPGGWLADAKLRNGTFFRETAAEAEYDSIRLGLGLQNSEGQELRFDLGWRRLTPVGTDSDDTELHGAMEFRRRF